MEAVRRWRERAPGAVLLDGFHAVKHALRFGAVVDPLLTRDRTELLALAMDLAVDLVPFIEAHAVEVGEAELGGLVPRPHPTGVAALADHPPALVLDAVLDAPSRTAPVVVLDTPRHLGNVGAVVRLVAGMAATGLVTTGDLDPWHPGVVRAAAGLHFATAVSRREPDALPDGPLFCLDPDGEPLTDVVFPAGVLLAFGSERRGLSPELRARAERLIALPMRPLVSSYNLATSVAMTLYHGVMTGSA
jgi:TrmH family RNA methyltransferase